MIRRYAVDPELSFGSGFNAPMDKVSARVGQALLGALPKFLDRLAIEVQRLDVPTSDGARIRMHLLSPRDVDKKLLPSLPCLVYLHGGAFMHKAVPTQYRLMQAYALGARCRVAAVDYRLVPQHPYPTPVEDCLAGLRYVLEHAGELRIIPSKVVIGGDSAGGSLALDTWLAAREQTKAGEAPFAEHLPQSLMLVYPVVDHRAETASMAAFTDTPIWNADKNARMWKWYLNGADYSSPLQRADEFAGLTSAFVEARGGWTG